MLFWGKWQLPNGVLVASYKQEGLVLWVASLPQDGFVLHLIQADFCNNQE
jgi:hypothetical protein